MQKTLERKTILITGGAGFIGSHLIEQLILSGEYDVYSLDNYFTGKKENHITGATYIEGHTKDIKKHISFIPDIIYHLGEYSRTGVAIEEPDVVFDFNMTGTFGVLEFARAHGSKVIYAGSSTKFAEGIEGKSLSPYTWSKSANCDLLRFYHEWYGVPYVIAYFYNNYGSRELGGKYGSVIEIFRNALAHGEPLKVNSPGTQRRNYTHVSDTARALLLIGEKGEGDGYGIGSPKSYSTLEVAQMFGGEITMMPQRRTSRASAALDTSKTEALGWSATHELPEYIASITSRRS